MTPGRAARLPHAILQPPYVKTCHGFALPFVSCMLSFSDIPTPPSTKQFHSRSGRRKRLAVIASLLYCLSFVLGTSGYFWHFIESSFAQFLCPFRTSCISKTALFKLNWSISIWQILFDPHHCIQWHIIHQTRTIPPLCVNQHNHTSQSPPASNKSTNDQNFAKFPLSLSRLKRDPSKWDNVMIVMTETTESSSSASPWCLRWIPDHTWFSWIRHPTQSCWIQFCHLSFLIGEVPSFLFFVRNVHKSKAATKNIAHVVSINHIDGCYRCVELLKILCVRSEMVCTTTERFISYYAGTARACQWTRAPTAPEHIFRRKRLLVVR